MAKSRAQVRSRLQERRIARDIGGQVQAGSGSSWRAKSDVRKMGDLRVEAKYTDKDSYALKHADIAKIIDESVLGGLEIWAIQVDFAKWKRKYAVVSYPYLRHAIGFQAEPREIQISDFVTQSKQILLHSQELEQSRLGAATANAYWCWRLNFILGDKTSPDFAITDWDEFLRLHEDYKP